jgi:hexosaminidase
MKRFLPLLAASLFIFSIMVTARGQNAHSSPAVIPLPVKMDVKNGEFVINEDTRIYFNDTSFESEAHYLNGFVEKPLGYTLEVTGDRGQKNTIKLIRINNDTLDEEGYFLEVYPDSVVISATRKAGIFYGIQTLLQLLPPEVYARQLVGSTEWLVPAVSVVDYPRFGWRGMHLDVSRHFFPKEFIKKYLDLIAMHKMNIFHWHLTDNNGWRLEIKKYPKLTEISAWRVDREDQPWRKRTPPKPGEKATYGGFYTQDDVREIVKYAAERNIMIIPEIEMPGHTGEVFAAYPELSCSGKKTYVSPGGWPGEDIFCAGNDSVFVFLENVLDEVFELFPSPYVHIGGDEADKRTWKKCPKCQQRIKDEHLKDEDELQSWFVKKIEKYIVAHGKKLIGWDEILEGGLAPEATVMSWRGEEGGIEAARQHHDAIMCPTSYCYFDYYQADPEFEPEAIGGLTTLKKVYSYDPVPAGLSEEQAKYILGGQGNVWTEFIPTPAKAEYMAVPRMTALAEVLWTPKNEKNWSDFRRRLETQFRRFDYMGVNYSKGSWQVDILAEPSKDGKKFTIRFETEQTGYPVYYTLDGKEPTIHAHLYKGPFPVDKTTTVKAGIFVDGKLKGKASEKTICFNKALGKKITLKYPPSEKYKGNGVNSLVDGITGSDNYRDGYWLGFRDHDLDLIIDLEKSTRIRDVELEFIHKQRSWIFAPAEVHVVITDEKDKVVASSGVVPKVRQKSKKTIVDKVRIKFKNVKGRYVHVIARRVQQCPDWHPGKGNGCWLFVDEVMVN